MIAIQSFMDGPSYDFCLVFVPLFESCFSDFFFDGVLSGGGFSTFFFPRSVFFSDGFLTFLPPSLVSLGGMLSPKSLEAVENKQLVKPEHKP